MAQLQITFTVPDARAAQIRDSFVYYHGYTDTIPDPQDLEGPEIPNPVSKVAYLKKKVGEFIKESVKAYHANQDAEVARLAAFDDVTQNVTLD